MVTNFCCKTILIAGETGENQQHLEQILAEQGYSISCVATGREVLEAVDASLPDLVLLGTQLPEVDGYDVCKTLKATEKTRAVPVIFFNIQNESEDKQRGFAAGAADYITKPLSLEYLDKVVFLKYVNMQIRDLGQI